MNAVVGTDSRWILCTELDRLTSGDIDGPSRLVKEQKANLEVKVKALEAELKKIQSEKRILEDNFGVNMFYLP